MTRQTRPDPANDKGNAAGADRLRDRIDRGGTGDKVPFADPAAAPLGTDAEAGGAPPTEDQVRRAEAAETGRARPVHEASDPADRQRPKRPAALWVAGLALVLGAGALAFAALAG